MQTNKQKLLRQKLNMKVLLVREISDLMSPVMVEDLVEQATPFLEVSELI